MYKVGLILLAFMISLLPVNAESNSLMQNNVQSKPMLFVYHIPDTEYENDSAFGVEKEAAGGYQDGLFDRYADHPMQPDDAQTF